MAESLEESIRRLASERCEYCRIPDSDSRLKHVLDHIIARQHDGTTELKNLALCCARCNLYKGPNISGIDSDTKQITRLVNPRTDIWKDHFRYEGAILIGMTPIGRATVRVLRINLPVRIAWRQMFLATGENL